MDYLVRSCTSQKWCVHGTLLKSVKLPERGYNGIIIFAIILPPFEGYTSFYPDVRRQAAH